MLCERPPSVSMSSTSYPSPEQQRQQMAPPLYFPNQPLMMEPSAYQDTSTTQSATTSFTFSPSYTFPLTPSPYAGSMSPPTSSAMTINSSAAADPMRRWYGSRNEEPWSAHSRSHAATLPVFSSTPFTRARTTAASDTESIITTHTTPPTTYSTHSGDEPVTTNQDNLPIQDSMANMKVMRRGAASRASSALEVPTSRGLSKTKPINLRCTYCNAETRTPSEFKKHRLKHEKPFKCPVQGCERSFEGFTTSNDLERHKKSKHRIFPEAGTVKCYKCASDTCTDKAKIWTRLDNFCQHLDRMHPRDNKDEMVKKSEYMYSKEDELAFGSSIDYDDSHDVAEDQNHDVFGFMGNQFSYSGADDQGFTNSMQIDPTLDISLSPPQQDFGVLFPPPVEAPWPVPDPNPPNQPTHQSPHFLDNHHDPGSYFGSFTGQQPTVVVHPSAPRDGQSPADEFINLARAQGYDLQSLAEAIQRRLSGPELPQPQSLSLDPMLANGFVPDQFSHLAASQQPPSVPRQPRKMSGSTTAGMPMNANAASQDIPAQSQEAGRRGKTEEKRFRCKYCPKLLPRQSTLKKHQKRHERLYGCTFASCNKMFGSKDDWKRHENSQHFQVDTWQCAESNKLIEYDGAIEKPCSKLFHRKEIFAEHLKRTHHITDKATITERCVKQHVASNSQTSFWCGFCCSVQQLSGLGSKAWDERFNHIGDHFTEGSRIKDWVRERDQHNSGERLATSFPTVESGTGKHNEAFIKDDDEDDDDDEDIDNDESEDEQESSGSNTPPLQSQGVLHTSQSDPAMLYMSNGLATVPRVRASSNAKRQRIDPQLETIQPQILTSADPSMDYMNSQPRHFIGQPATSEMANSEIFCCQCGMGPFYFEIHVQCFGYNNCNHAFCGDCLHGARKRQRSYSSQPLLSGSQGLGNMMLPRSSLSPMQQGMVPGAIM